MCIGRIDTERRQDLLDPSRDVELSDALRAVGRPTEAVGPEQAVAVWRPGECQRTGHARQLRVDLERAGSVGADDVDRGAAIRGECDPAADGRPDGIGGNASDHVRDDPSGAARSRRHEQVVPARECEQRSVWGPCPDLVPVGIDVERDPPPIGPVARDRVETVVAPDVRQAVT